MTKLDKYIKELTEIKRIEAWGYRDLCKLIGIAYRTLYAALNYNNNPERRISRISIEKIQAFVDSWKEKNPEYSSGLQSK